MSSTSTQQTVTATIDHIMQSLWNGVAQSIIAKKLALTCAQMQVFEYVASYVSNATQNKEQQTKMYEQCDPISIPIDNIAYGELLKEVAPRKADDKTSRKMSVTDSINQTRSRKFTFESANKQKSPESKQAIQQQKTNLITLPQIEDPHYIQDPGENGCRALVFRSEKEAIEMKKMINEREKIREQSGNKNKKLIKDLKKFTYDYDGKFFGTGNKDNGHQKTLKINNSSSQQNITQKQIKNPESKTIFNQKIKERDSKNNRDLSKDDKNAPQFNDKRPQSLIDMFEEDEKLAEGIKLIGDKGKQKVIKQRPRRKLSGMKQYRLNEYQGLTKDRKFKDFKKLAVNLSTATIDVSRTAPLNYFNPESNKGTAQQNLEHAQSKATSQVSIKMKKQKPEGLSILPQIQSSQLKQINKLGFKRLSIGYQQSSRSLLNESGLSSHKSRKSQIKIDHEMLYNENFANN